jgi:hypothetical protein
LVVATSALKAVRLALVGLDRYTMAARRSAWSTLTKLVSGSEVASIRLGARSRLSQLVTEEKATYPNRPSMVINGMATRM